MEVRCNLHCGGLGENVNAGRQPPFHDCPKRSKKKERMASTVGCIGGNEMKEAKREKRKKNQTQANSCLSIKTGPFIIKTHEAS